MQAANIHIKMLNLAVLLVLAAVAFAAPRDQQDVPLLDGKIVGGQQVKISDYPYQVSVLYNNQHNCGGSIIGMKYILTAAHCTDGLQPNSLSIRVGSVNVDNGGNVIKVAKIHQHPNYNGATVDYDISILELAQELTLGPNVGIIKLPEDREFLSEGTKATVIGWGALRENGAAAEKLQAITVPVISVANCKKAYGTKRITKRMFCAGMLNVGGKDSCQGDSGGPLIVNNVLQGVVSWGRGCASSRFPGVYTSVAYLRDFIKLVTGI